MSTGVATRAAPDRRARTIPALGGALVVAGFVGLVVTLALVVRAHAWPELVPVLLPAPWLVAAAVAVRARPDHPGALLFLGLGAGHLVAFAVSEPVSLHPTWNGWGAWTANLVATECYLLGFAALGCFLATYPSGVAGGRGVRWFVRGAFGVAAVGALVGQLVSNPVVLVSQGGRPSMPAPPGLPLVQADVPFVVLGPLSVVVGAGLLVARSRRAGGTERRQMSWAVGAAGLLALLLLATPAMSRFSEAAQTAVFVSVVSVLPFVLLAGLVRYRLMDVDLFVIRTLARGTVVVLVLSVFALVTGLAGHGDPALAAGLAALAALTGTPVVRRLERLADRWLAGGRVRGQALLRQLSDQLVAPSPLDQARRTAETVRSGLEASWVRLVADGIDVLSGTPGPRAEAAAVVPVLAAGTEVGRLECGPRHGGWGAAELAEVSLLARHVGLALRNAELTERLEQQVEELTASRRRIVRAELAVRKQLERDLHDGVQQRVVALVAHLGALRVLVPAGSRAEEVTETTLAQARSTLAELREVVEGVQPPVLLDRGLVAAVESRAALLPLPVRVGHVEAAPRWEDDVEVAAYYVVSEALTNVVKHAEATSAAVRIEQLDGHLVVTVSDDGKGLGAAGRGTGVAGMHDRVEALGGTVEVRSGDRGTVVTARLPTGGDPR